MFEEYLDLIKKKRELSGIDDSVITGLLVEKNKKSPFPENPSFREKKIIVKHIRSELRKYVGRFSISQKERMALLRKGEINKLLETHSSTKERMPFYSEIRNLIINLKPITILDLGCGLNPLALSGIAENYLASDINLDDLEIVENFFKINSIKGKVFVRDVRELEEPFPQADLTLILKVFDVVEKKGHKLAEKIISRLNSSHIIVSFSTKTLSGRPMNHPQRGWIEKMLSRLNLQFSVFKIKNEIFYIIKKI